MEDACNGIKDEESISLCVSARFLRTGQFIAARAAAVASSPWPQKPKCKAPSFVIDGVRCQTRRSKKAAWDDLIYVGNAGWRGSDAVAPSFLVKSGLASHSERL